MDSDEWWLTSDNQGQDLGNHDTSNIVTQLDSIGDDHRSGDKAQGGRAMQLAVAPAKWRVLGDEEVHLV